MQFLKPDALLKFLDYDNLLLFVSYDKEMNEAIFWFIQTNDQQYGRTGRQRARLTFFFYSKFIFYFLFFIFFLLICFPVIKDLY